MKRTPGGLFDARDDDDAFELVLRGEEPHDMPVHQAGANHMGRNRAYALAPMDDPKLPRGLGT